MVAILQFWTDLVIVKIEHSKGNRVLSGAVQGTDHSSSVFAIDRIYEFYSRTGVSLVHNRRSSQASSLTGKNSASAL